MKATLIFRKRIALEDPVETFAEMVVWRVSEPVSGSRHNFKYRLALVHRGACVLRYDNEAGKGDHKHMDGRELPYRFVDLERLQDDFWRDVEKWREGR